jgi:hypothetical protein
VPCSSGFGVGPQESPDYPALPVPVAGVHDTADLTDPPLLVHEVREPIHETDQLEHIRAFFTEALLRPA